MFHSVYTYTARIKVAWAALNDIFKFLSVFTQQSY